MLDFAVEWHDAPGVKDTVLAKTWARLEIFVSDHQSHPRCLTRCIRSKANSVQRGVYGSIFPLAEWVVENWWFLLFEPVRVAKYRGGRSLDRNVKLRQWAQRHNLMAAREGGALPDLTFFRDECDIVACWFPDPDQEDRNRPTRFISGAGETRLDPRDLEHPLHQLVETVLERLDTANDEDTRRLRDNWQALCSSRTEEADLCGWAASLGLDPYDPDQLDDQFSELLEHEVAGLPGTWRTDLLKASAGQFLQADLQWLKNASDRLNPLFNESASIHSPPGLTERKSTAPYQFGYDRARWLRASMDIPVDPIPDLAKVLHERFGWPSDPQIILEGSAAPSLNALVGRDSHGHPRVVEKPGRPDSRQYSLARALYFVPDAEACISPRLITRSFTWDQQASRAFAAELLAPAEALRRLVDERNTDESIADIAQVFNVSSWVIEHQLENHSIAALDS